MDQRLISAARQGDHDAFAGIVRDLTRQFHGIAFAILRDAHLAEDAVQSALISIWRDLPRLRDTQKFPAWSKRILVNACYREARRRRRYTAEVSEEAMPALAAQPDDGVAPSGLNAVLDRDQLERGFRHLSVEQRSVMVLHFFLDLKVDQGAEILGIPEGTYRSRVHRATKALRAGLDTDARGAAVPAASPEAVR